MPPLEPSIRGLLLTSASAVALSVSAAARAAPYASPNLTIWGEGSSSWTGGGDFNVPTIPSLTAPYTPFLPGAALEGAVGFDYHWESQPWHFIFDMRYGKTPTKSSNSSSSTSSTQTSRSTAVTYPTGSIVHTIITDKKTTTKKSHDANSGEEENHFVADFMIGRDLGVGTSSPQLQLGIRIADLYASADAQQTNTTNVTTQTTKTTYYSSAVISGPTTTSASSSTSSSTSAAWSSRFFGVGPRLAYVGSTPIRGHWSFDYSGGVALLFGNRTFNVLMSNGYSRHERTTTLVFNMDGWLALTYSLSRQYKISGGLRGDYYNAALTTYDINTGGLQNIDRIYWGPFVRLTRSFW